MEGLQAPVASLDTAPPRLSESRNTSAAEAGLWVLEGGVGSSSLQWLCSPLRSFGESLALVTFRGSAVSILTALPWECFLENRKEKLVIMRWQLRYPGSEVRPEGKRQTCLY